MKQEWRCKACVGKSKGTKGCVIVCNTEPGDIGMAFIDKNMCLFLCYEGDWKVTKGPEVLRDGWRA